MVENCPRILHELWCPRIAAIIEYPRYPVNMSYSLTGNKSSGVVRATFLGGQRYRVQQVSLVWYKDDLSIRPDLAESWKISDDAKQWTFKLREGIKWSGGKDLTTDDFKWWYDNVLNNETLTNLQNTQHGSWITGKNRSVMKAEFPDKLTAVFTFADANPLFLFQVTRNQPFAPTDFMKQFHADFADKATLDAAVKEAVFETWDKLFDDRNRPLIGGRPSTGTWVATNKLGDQLFTMERNPYFAQVDSSGSSWPRPR